MDQCIFCKLLSDHTAKMVYEDEFTAAFMDIAGDVDGHILVVPKKHTKSILDADEITLSRVMSTVQNNESRPERQPRRSPPEAAAATPLPWEGSYP